MNKITYKYTAYDKNNNSLKMIKSNGRVDLPIKLFENSEFPISEIAYIRSNFGIDLSRK